MKLIKTDEAAATVAGENVRSAQQALIRALAEHRQIVGRNPGFLYDENIGSIRQELLEGAQLLTDRLEMLRRLPKGGRAMEVGTFRGHFALKMLDLLEPTELHIVDISFDRFDWEAHKNHPLAGRVKTYAGNSCNVMETFHDSLFDLIYIDANHMYEFVRKELPVAADKLCSGGILAANDYMSYSPLNGHKYGVAKAVNEFVNARGYQVRYFALQPGGYYDIAFQKPLG